MKKFRLAFYAALFLASGSVAAGPAPSLSYVQVRYIGSSTQGWEAISDNQLSTNLDHGGPLLRALTVEVGYGSSPAAFMNGARLPNSANYSTVAFCSSNFLTPCQPGQTVIGFVRYWSLDGYQNGNFYFQNTSTNAPRNTMGDGVYIR